MIEFIIHIIQSEEKYKWNFDENKSIKELKIDLEDKKKIKKGSYYIDFNFYTMNDNMILKDYGVVKDSCLSIVDNNYFKIEIQIIDYLDVFHTVRKYDNKLKYSIITPDERNIVKVCNNC